MSKKRPSRRERFEAAIGKLGDPKSEIECLRDELQDWLDSMPENLQGSQKAEDLEAAISNLDEIINQLEEAENTEVEFPGMMG